MAKNWIRREFLNKDDHGGSAHVIASVENDGAWSSGSFAIMDCNRKAELDFSLYDEELIANSFHKLDLIIDTLKEFRKELKKAEKIARKANEQET